MFSGGRPVQSLHSVVQKHRPFTLWGPWAFVYLHEFYYLDPSAAGEREGDKKLENKVAALVCPSNWRDCLEGRTGVKPARADPPRHSGEEAVPTNKNEEIRRKAQKAGIGCHTAAQHLCSYSYPEDNDWDRVGLTLFCILHPQIYKVFFGPPQLRGIQKEEQPTLKL